MFVKVQMPWNVILSPKDLHSTSLMLQASIIKRLLDDFSAKKANKNVGYFLGVTTLDSIGEARIRPQTGEVIFPVVFSGVSFKIFKGEVLQGIVHKVLKHGVFLRCGLIENAYLSCMKMPDYRYIAGENPSFVKDMASAIAKKVAVRVIVLGTKWLEAEKEFQALVSLEGDYLGPISSPDVQY